MGTRPGYTMRDAIQSAEIVRFGPFEVDLRTQELRRNGRRIRLPGQAFQVLATLLSRPGDLVTREELQQKLWPEESFGDFEHGLTAAVNRLREALRDSPEKPLFVETLPRRGYRFVAPIERSDQAAQLTPEMPLQNKGATQETAEQAHPGEGQFTGKAASSASEGEHAPMPVGVTNAAAPAAESDDKRGAMCLEQRKRRWARCTLIAAGLLLAVTGSVFYLRTRHCADAVQRTLTRLTFDEGLQAEVTWSPDGRLIAYSSDRSGEVQIWVQQISGGDPVQVTNGPGPNWQPDWSPDGKYIAYRSETGEGGIFVVPALGGAGLEHKIAHFGHYPRWSPDSSRVLLSTESLGGHRFYVASLDESSPREILIPRRGEDSSVAISATWHPDGERVSLWVVDHALMTFWTVPVTGGSAISTKMSPELERRLGEQWRAGEMIGWVVDHRFAWAPSAKAIYFEHTSHGARNIWRIRVDPKTLRATAVEQLTTGPGQYAELALSRDGKKLAFTEESQRTRIWAFPFDAKSGRLKGEPEPVTTAGIDAWMPSLSPDGRRLAFAADRAGRWELWEKSLANGKAAPIRADEYSRSNGIWSPDSKRLAYLRRRLSTGEEQVVIWSSESRTEEPITQRLDNGSMCEVYDWSPDGKELLLTKTRSATWSEIQVLPLAAAPEAEKAARILISDPAYLLFQGRYSPDGEWVAFEAVKQRATQVESTIYVRRAAGSSWIPITDGRHWADKPRWSPDGKTLYYVTDDGGFLNAWGIRFDAREGKPGSQPFRVTCMHTPSLMVPYYLVGAEMSLAPNRVVLPLAQVSGSIWMLDNVDQ